MLVLRMKWLEKAVILSDGGMISAEDIDGGNQQRKEKPLEEVQTLDIGSHRWESVLG